ncbi:hypothetical protein AAFF_G00138060 [Aldrovandia affinis]|uniref:Coiled-coil SMC6 And NSE5 INteracting (CANIN) domain-containing protein n=1 Tax=Aldrovandia affinis TaxID=143900 RepID=A0AAD7TBV4_9TELE|nr:hypothetical protein AAFF_G00138060 [Aldrovandia affinis]
MPPAQVTGQHPEACPCLAPKQLPARQGLDPPCREGKEGGAFHCRSPVQQGPLPDKGGPKGSPPLELCSRRQPDLGAANGLSPPTSSSRPIRAAQPQRERRSSTSNRDTSVCTPSTAKVATKHLNTSTSPPVRAASGTEDSPNTSPPLGCASPDVAEDGALSDLELHLGAYAGRGSSSASSSSSEDEPLLSLKEILERSVRPPHTPDKAAFSEPSTPIQKLPAPTGKSRPVNYKNTLEQMLKDKEENQRLKEIELKLLVTCKEDLLKLAEEEDGDDITEEAISHEHRAILKRFSVVSNGIPDVHPGEEVFTLSNFGRLFSQHSLDLRRCAVTPQNPAQKTLLQASPEEQLFLIGSGLLLKAYRSSPCQPAVTSWLFQMMSVHLDRRTSTQILRSMKDIALIAADQIVMSKSRTFEVWMPSVQDVALIFLNMGVPFVTLFSLEALQPPFSEGDILQSTNFCSEEDSSRNKLNRDSFPEHNFENVIKYLALCVALCPRAYTDQELLLLLTVVCRVSLETRLQLLPTEDVCWLLYHLVNNMRDWDSQLPQICLALTDMTEDHHNLRRLVQLLPDHKRGKQLRKHLSVSIISKLLNHRCTYKPVNAEFQLSALLRYLPRMRPSALLSAFFPGKKKKKKKEEEEEDRMEGEVCAMSQDQQAYYLCYSLLALANEASNFDTFPSTQKDPLRLLSAQLDKYIKSEIREGEQWLYRSKVKDFVARISTRWQMLLHKSRPMQGKLHDYWQPPPEDMVSSSQESQQGEPQADETAINIVSPVTTQTETDGAAGD